MTNRHYILTLNRDVNSYVGYYYAELLPVSSESNKNLGTYSWYAGPKRWTQQIPDIAARLQLIEKEFYSYDVRSGSKYFYVISERFRAAVSSLKTSFKQVVPIDCIVAKNEVLKDQKLYAAIPRKFFESECIVANTGFLTIKPNFDYDLFDVKDVPIHVATLICTERCKSALIDAGISGLDFIPTDEVEYPRPLKSYEFNTPDSDYIPV